jgi:hypothetical protein
VDSAATIRRVPIAAPRIHPALLFALERIDRTSRPIAETHRRLGAIADLIGVPRPSYQRTRELVHEHRRRKLKPSAGRILFEVATSQTPKLTLNRLLND